MKTKENKEPQIKIANLDEVFKPLFDLIDKKLEEQKKHINNSDEFKGFM
jgi:hemerythrin